MDVSSALVYCHPCAGDVSLPELTVPELLERVAREAPGAPAVDFVGRTYSYAQILQEARRVAAGLAARGIAKGDRVGLYLPKLPTGFWAAKSLYTGTERAQAPTSARGNWLQST